MLSSYKSSLTYYLKKIGGLNIDLSAVSIDLFKFSRPKDFNIQAAITDFDGKLLLTKIHQSINKIL